MASYIPYSGQTNVNSNLPDWMKTAIGNVGNIGPGAASSVHTSGPQEFSALKKMWDESLGGAQAQLDPAAIKALFGDSISAAMTLGGEQINSAEGDRGAAVRPGGVAQQKMTDLGLKVQQPLTEALLGNMNTGLQFNQGSLAKLFESASGPQTNAMSYRNNPQDINSKLPPYVQQSNPAGAGGGGGGGGNKGGSGGGGGGTSETPWWQTSYDSMNNGAGAAYNAAHPGSLEGFGNGVPGSGGLENLYDSNQKPESDYYTPESGGSGPAGAGTQAVDTSSWRNFGSAPNAGTGVASYADFGRGKTGVGEWRPGTSGDQWWGAY